MSEVTSTISDTSPIPGTSAILDPDVSVTPATPDISDMSAAYGVPNVPKATPATGSWVDNISAIHTPYYIVDENLLIKNLEILKNVSERAGCKILLAQKAFSMFYFYPLIGKYLNGTAASGLFEAKLGYEEMSGMNRKEQYAESGVGSHTEAHAETHIFSAAYPECDFDEILEICDHIIFNSFSQWEKYKRKCINKNVKCADENINYIDEIDEGTGIIEKGIEESLRIRGLKNAGRHLTGAKRFGIRVNPERSTQGAEHSIYDPCSAGSRLGVTAANFPENLPAEISGLHFHTLCEQNADALIETLKAFEEKFGKYLDKIEWVNFGGGHHITRPDYDIEALVKCIIDFKAKYGVEVYLEPGEAVALNTGYLVSTVLDIVKNNNMSIAILDVSAACHMPDVLEMPYRPAIVGAIPADLDKSDIGTNPNESGNGTDLNRSDVGTDPDRSDAENIYRLGGPTCLAGDIIGDYSFDKPIKIGDRLIFCDMAHYSMVKNNTFNGMNLPSIAVADRAGNIKLIRKFGYEDFKHRLS